MILGLPVATATTILAAVAMIAVALVDKWLFRGGWGETMDGGLLIGGLALLAGHNPLLPFGAQPLALVAASPDLPPYRPAPSPLTAAPAAPPPPGAAPA